MLFGITSLKEQGNDKELAASLFTLPDLLTIAQLQFPISNALHADINTLHAQWLLESPGFNNAIKAMARYRKKGHFPTTIFLLKNSCLKAS